MKPHLLVLAAVLAASLLSGCVGGMQYRYNAEEVHRTISWPGFNDEIHATGISKEGNVRKAATLTHSTSLLGFARTATYKGAELEIIPPEEPPAVEEPPPESAAD